MGALSAEPQRSLGAQVGDWPVSMRPGGWLGLQMPCPRLARDGIGLWWDWDCERCRAGRWWMASGACDLVL